MLLDHVINFNFDYAPEKFGTIAKNMGIDIRGMNHNEIKKRLLSCVVELKQEGGISKQLRNRGVQSSDIPILAKKAIKDACILTNPRKCAQRDIEVIFEDAM